MSFTLKTHFGRSKKTSNVSTLAEASRRFGELRDESGEGASNSSEGLVFNSDAEHVATISYNGRVWEPKSVGSKLIMEAVYA